MKKNIITESVKKGFDSFVIRTIGGVKEVRHFHPSGRTMPNGVYIQRGGYFTECWKNRNAFMLDEGVHGEQHGLSSYKGGVIVLSTDVNAVELSPNAFANKVRHLVKTYENRLRKGRIIHKSVNSKGTEHIGSYSVGRIFSGKYVGANGEIYDEKSLSVEVNGLSSRSLLKFSGMLAGAFGKETVLVKDLNTGKIYIVDPIPSSAFAALQEQ